MRKLIYILVGSIGLLLLGYTAYRGYLVWRENRLITMARAYLAKADTKDAVLSLQQLIHGSPRNLEATRLMAGLMDAEHSPDAIFWWQRAVELNPKSTENRLALAKSALTLKNFALASSTLAGVSEADQNTASFQELAGGMALLMGRLDQAETNFSEALRLEPANPLHKVNLALLRLHGTNALDMAEARIDLKRVIQSSTNAELRHISQRELVLDALRSKDLPAAMSLSQELIQLTNAVFADSLLRLDVLLEAKSPELNPSLARYQREATNTSANLFDLSNWQMDRLSPAETLAWLQGLPRTMQTNMPAALQIAKCQLLLGRWKAMQDLLAAQDWGQLNFERHALLARSLREQNLAESAKSEWQQALNATKNNKIALKTLFSMARELRWDSEADQILWTIFNLYPEETAAWLSLRDHLIASGNTRLLLHLIDLQSRRNPSDVTLKNDMALIALLLKADEFSPNELARTIYPNNETNASIASTYAFSLYLQGKPAEALKVMARLKPQDLANPGIAGYYGLILKANGRTAEAMTYFKLSAAAQLLPEERALFDKVEKQP